MKQTQSHNWPLFIHPAVVVVAVVFSKLGQRSVDLATDNCEKIKKITKLDNWSLMKKATL